MNDKIKLLELIKIGGALYELDVKLLDAKDSYQTFISAMLSPQTTDKKVNEITPLLYEKYNDFEALSKADLTEVEIIIRQLGFKSKAINIIEASKLIVEKYKGIIPNDYNELKTIKGIGPKCAGVILHYIYNKPALIIDTHFLRCFKRLGILNGNLSVFNIEKQLKSLLEEKYWCDLSITLNLHAKRYCKIKPLCKDCPVFFCKNRH